MTEVKASDNRPDNSIWKNKKFLRVWLSSSMSILGDTLAFVVLPLWILAETDSPLLVAGLNTAIALTTIFLTPITGTLADRMSRRNLMIAANIIRFICMIILSITAFFNLFLYGFLIVLMVIRTIGASMYSPASSALLQQIVIKDHIPKAVSIRQISNSLIDSIGPAFGGLFVAVLGFSGVLFLDAATFLISYILLMGLSLPEDAKKKPKGLSFKKDIIEGILLFKRNSTILTLVLSATFVNFLGSGLIIAIQLHTISDMGLNSLLYGIVLSSSPIGISLGAYIVSKLNPTKRGIFSFTCLMFMGLFNFFMGLTFNFYLLSILFFISGLFFGMSNVMFGVLYREVVPNEKQGRFFGLLGSLLLITTPIGISITGVVLELYSANIILSIMGLSVILVGGISLIPKKIRFLE